MAKFEVPEGMVVQAFQFALDLTEDEARVVRRQFGGRRYAYNWAVRTMKADIAAYRATGDESPAPSAFGLRKRWNQVKDTECADDETGEVWWPEVSKEAFADGIAGAVDAYWNWQTSRAGSREGRRMGFPRFKKKGRDRDRVTFTTGAIRVEPDRRHVTLPRIGTVRVHENTRRLQRLIAKERARILAATVTRKGRRIVVAFRVLVARPQQPHLARPDSTVGVDVGVRVLATPSGCGHPRTPHAQSDHEARQDPRHHRGRGTGCGGDASPKGLTGARARRRGLSDAALAEPRRQLGYKTGWYGSRLVVADRWYPSSKTCHKCLHKQDIGWAEHWTCNQCGTRHQRDDNASINLARYEATAQPVDSAVGPVRATVKRGADHKTGPRPAGGEEARKAGRRKPAEQPRDGVPV